jgi:SAM-dependent methyltransferase
VPTHDDELAQAFDGQAERFERSPVMTEAASLARLVAVAALPAGARVLDAGCGPGLVAEAFLDAGCEVVGVDLSSEMIRRARLRCERFGERARFERCSLHELPLEAPFDACVSRNVLHHIEDPSAFVARQASLARPGGVVLAFDLSADADPERAAWADEVERDRDRTHVRTLTPGELVDAFARARLADVRLVEEELTLDFDEWFDRGTPAAPKDAVRARLLEGTSRGFAPRRRADGGFEIRCLRALVRGTKPR